MKSNGNMAKMSSTKFNKNMAITNFYIHGGEGREGRGRGGGKGLGGGDDETPKEISTKFNENMSISFCHYCSLLFLVRHYFVMLFWAELPCALAEIANLLYHISNFFTKI